MEQGNFCEKCGKGFKSPRAVFGHMRLHSKKKSFSATKIVEFPKPVKKKRSERRYNEKNYSLSNLNPCGTCSSSMTVNFDCVDKEMEEIAVCLLMLKNGGFCSFYSPVDKLVSDDEDGSVKMDPIFRIESGQISNVVHDNVIEVANYCDLGCGYVSFRVEVTNLCGFDGGFSISGPSFGVRTENRVEPHNNVHDNVVNLVNCDLGCGYVSSKEEVAEFCGFIRGFSRSSQENLNPKPCFDEHTDNMIGVLNTCNLECGYVSFNVDVREFSEGFSRSNQENHNPRRTFDVQRGSTIDCLKKPFSDIDNENEPESSATINIKDEHNDKHICNICNKSFKSGQSLGGHKLHCPISKRYRSSISLPQLSIHDVKKKRREKHKCVHCCRNFNSGRALGVHVRVHAKGRLEFNKKEFDGPGTTVMGEDEEVYE